MLSSLIKLAVGEARKFGPCPRSCISPIVSGFSYEDMPELSSRVIGEISMILSAPHMLFRAEC